MQQEHVKLEQASAWHSMAFFGLALLAFLIMCVGYYSAYELGAFPDETAHLGYILDVIDKGFPDYKQGKDAKVGRNQKLNYLKHPALYYVITGNTPRFFYIDKVQDHKRFRLANVIFSTLTLLVIYLSIRRLCLSPWSLWMGLTFILTIPMFVVLSVAVNNDPLMILGCALVTFSLVELIQHERPLLALILFLTGFVITFLTKATGALTVVTIVSYFVVFYYKNIIHFYSIAPKARIITPLALMIVLIYYVGIYVNFGTFFPTPQGAPRDWYAAVNPDAPRWSLMEHLSRFLESNYISLVNVIAEGDIPGLAGRDFTLGSILMVFIILVLYTIYSALHHGKYKPIILGLTLSFVTFMVIYFVTIRGMHLSTGYTKAMQARYFFGFLPGAAILVAIACDSIRSALLRLSLTALFVVGLFFSIYPIYAKLTHGYGPGQLQANVHFGELLPGRRFEQSFVADDNTIHRVELLLATYIRINTATIKIQLVDESNSVMASSDINASELADNSWASFGFGADGVAVVPGEKYLIRLISDDSKPGNAITWWAAERKEEKQSPFTGTPYGPPDPLDDYFVQGEALVDGNIVKADFAFKIYFSP